MADTGKRIGSQRERGAGGAEGSRQGGRGYAAPRLERLGEWKALTLQQSVPIHGYNLLVTPDVTRRLS